jgi:hypothetical protein
VLRRNVHRIVAKFPNALILGAAWGYIGTLLLFPGRGLPRHSRLVENSFGVGSEALYGIVFTALAVLVLVGYLGYFSDCGRKTIYLLGGVCTAAVAAALAADGSWLSAGLTGIFAGLALDTYWRFPRRHEHDTERIQRREGH